MQRKTFKYIAVLACAVLNLTALSAPAEDKRDDKDKRVLSGTWVVQGGELKIEFSDQDVMKIFPHGENPVIIVLCQYTAEKNGLINAKITGLEGEGKEKVKEHVPVGLEFRFTWRVKDDLATLGDLKGKDVEPLKSHLEGTYDRKK